MMKGHRLLSVAAAVLAAGCVDSVATHGIRIDSPIDIRLHEVLSTSGRSIELRGSIEKVFGCMNDVIRFRSSQTGDARAIEFVDVRVPGACLTALGPARCTVPL